MLLGEGIKKRRSVRQYESYKMPRKDIEEILEAAMLAPSAKNTRPWTYVVIESEEAKEKAVRVHPFARHLLDASIGILVCADLTLPEVEKMGFYPQDCGASVQNILLKSLELGYGSCWCGVYPMEERVKGFKDAFQISALPIALVIVGKAKSEPACKGYYDESKIKFV